MSQAAVPPVLVIHGGAGVIKRDLTPAKEKAIRAALTQALESGYAELKAGKSADAEGFRRFLISRAGKAIFARYGFAPL